MPDVKPYDDPYILDLIREDSGPGETGVPEELVSIVVLSLDRLKLLRSTLSSLRECTDHPYELILVDDGSRRRGIRRYLFRLLERAEISTLILNAGPPLGIGEAVNRGFRAAHGAYLCKVDADVAFTPGWLGKCVSALEAFPEVGLLGGHGARFWDDPHFATVEAARRWSGDELERDGIRLRAVEAIFGCHNMMRREVFEKVGPYDPQKNWAADMDYMVRVRNHGLLLAHTWEPLIEHLGWRHSSFPRGDRTRASRAVPRVFGAPAGGGPESGG